MCIKEEMGKIWVGLGKKEANDLVYLQNRKQAIQGNQAALQVSFM